MFMFIRIAGKCEVRDLFHAFWYSILLEKIEI